MVSIRHKPPLKEIFEKILIFKPFPGLFPLM